MTRHALLFVPTIAMALILGGCGTQSPPANTPQTNTATVSNANSSSNSGTNSVTNTTTGVEQKVTGQVFVKSYGTPSESYGVLLSNGQEIGMNAYDTMKEELRAYVGKNISVTFSSVCDPTLPTCCRTVFDRCGVVKNWNPINTNQ